MVKGIVYRITAYEGILGWTHGMGKEVTEIYMPELGLAVNKMAIFKVPDKRRYEDARKVSTIKIDAHDVEFLKKHVESESRARRIAEKYLNKIDLEEALEEHKKGETISLERVRTERR